MTARRPLPVVAMCASALLAVLGCHPASTVETSGERWPEKLDDQQFWEIVRTFSEPDGVFTPGGGYRSDNPISNERSLQQVMPALLFRQRSGAYIGVGPEQNFTYIAALEPTIAFVIDIRRENLLLHLLYKAIAEESADRVEFLSRLFARPRPFELRTDASIEALFEAFQNSPSPPALARANLGEILGRLEETHHFSLNAQDKVAIRGNPRAARRIPSHGRTLPTESRVQIRDACLHNRAHRTVNVNIVGHRLPSP
jgi:hypothetical protein